ncbi:MAG: amidophosphoribosyltransferase [Candidatus Latescibacteria bacterium]|jgi:amidophosphoribosyltransferase|nr:amidophosphoribosyltransferase [Candidatus Latescibacterota bacterium]MBT4136771.1 amidophosphoribosyltransferase [Candidatus Latescibacterota bacterium]MBT5829732.1 amidophosphoribosyltransferase [Candidatus Latescibacterota bacterium]
MSEDLKHECGVAALYWLNPSNDDEKTDDDFENVAALMPAMLLDLQNRGQLASGYSAYNPNQEQIINTTKDLGGVTEAFRMSHQGKHKSIISENAGIAAIGHTRYATSGEDDVRYAQPFERQHGRLWKWFAMAFNGNLANYTALRERLLSKRGYHFTLNIDTEIIMHTLAYQLRGERKPDLVKVMKALSNDFDGAYNIAFLDALGRMVVSRDPLGLRPMCWGQKGRLFAAANESTALVNLGITDVHHLEPGEMLLVENGQLSKMRYTKPVPKKRCFFEWVYFSNVASEIDGQSVYKTRADTGRLLAEKEDKIIDKDSIVVPVPDTAKAAADAFAYHLNIPCMEGIIRNRYVGRTFIQPKTMRTASAKSKYTPLASVLSGKRIFLVEDSVVRSLTMRTLVKQLRELGNAAEIHLRVACPPIIAPCFYGIDMSTLNELFAPKHIPARYNGTLDEKTLKKMADDLEVDSLRYLNVSDLGPSLNCDNDTLCLGCVTGKHPTTWGKKLMREARKHPDAIGRMYG